MQEKTKSRILLEVVREVIRLRHLRRHFPRDGTGDVLLLGGLSLRSSFQSSVIGLIQSYLVRRSHLQVAFCCKYAVTHPPTESTLPTRARRRVVQVRIPRYHDVSHA